MILDLSAITDALIGLVKTAWTNAPIWAELGDTGPTFTPTFTGLAPDAARQGHGPQLSMYLYHVEPDSASEMLFWRPQMVGGTASPTTFLPLALNLYYLLFAYSQTSYAQEHEAMSVALRVYHDNPIVRSAPGAAAPWELTLTMEHRSYDELSRLWQATTAPLRMSLVFRAAVAFIEGDTAPADAPKPRAVTILGGVDGLAGPTPDYPVVVSTSNTVTYTPPTGNPVTDTSTPATAAAGGTVVVSGRNLGRSGVSDRVFLLLPNGAETDVTTWAQLTQSSATRFVLTLPSSAGAAPASTPPPGVYQLRVGSGALGSAGAVRTGATPFNIAAAVTPAATPVLAGAPPYTVAATGLVPAATEALVGTAPLAASGTGTPGPGQVKVSATSLTFAPPAVPAGTVAPLRVRVNGIESTPAVWVTV